MDKKQLTDYYTAAEAHIDELGAKLIAFQYTAIGAAVLVFVLAIAYLAKGTKCA
jgi:hypothetical protein